MTQQEYDYIWELIETLRSAWAADVMLTAPENINKRTFIDAAEWLEGFINRLIVKSQRHDH